MALLSNDRNSYDAQPLLAFTSGIDIDKRLYQQEIRVQKAWVRALADIQVLSFQEMQLALSTFDEALQLMADNAFPWRVEDEDIHINLERFLTERNGDLGQKIHLGRSRNDLIATTLKLFTSEACQKLAKACGEFKHVLMEKALYWKDVTVPAMTHWQHAQPISLGQIFQAYGRWFDRDEKDLKSVSEKAMDEMPLGSAAVKGTHLPIHFDSLCEELGFQNPPQCPYDHVGDRDFIIDALAACARVAMHLSRLATDIAYGTSTPVGLYKLSPQWSTGSSIMPNKRNPDVAELVRAKSAIIMGCHQQALAILKGLPSSYNSDLHEMKRVLILAIDQVSQCLNAMNPFMNELDVDENVAQALCKKGHIQATELANQMTKDGVPFRQAYKDIAGRVVEAERRGLQIHEL